MKERTIEESLHEEVLSWSFLTWGFSRLGLSHPTWSLSKKLSVGEIIVEKPTTWRRREYKFGVEH